MNLTSFDSVKTLYVLSFFSFVIDKYMFKYNRTLKKSNYLLLFITYFGIIKLS